MKNTVTARNLAPDSRRNGLTNKFDVKTFPEADGLLLEKSEDLNKFYNEVLCYLDGNIKIERIDCYQKAMRVHERDIILLHNSLRVVRKNISSDLLNDWWSASAECNYHNYRIMEMSNRLEEKRKEARIVAEKLFIDSTAALFAVSLVPNAAFSLASEIPIVKDFALPIAGIFAFVGVSLSYKQIPSGIIMTGRNWGTRAFFSAGKFLGDSEEKFKAPIKPCKSFPKTIQKKEERIEP